CVNDIFPLCLDLLRKDESIVKFELISWAKFIIDHLEYEELNCSFSDFNLDSNLLFCFGKLKILDEELELQSRIVFVLCKFLESGRYYDSVSMLLVFLIKKSSNPKDYQALSQSL